MSCKVTILIDDTEPLDATQHLECEHGFSAYIEAWGKKILLDMGSSSLFISNAKSLGVNLSEVDFAIVSHAHADHTGGLGSFLESSNAPVYIAEEIQDSQYYSSRGGTHHSISPDSALFTNKPERFVWCKQSKWLCEGIAIIKNTKNNFPRPYGNSFQSVCHCGVESADNYSHELSLAITTPKGIVIFSPCSHSGLFNIIESAKEFTKEKTVATFVGGFHIIKSNEVEREASQFLSTFITTYASTQFITGHCTTPQAISLLTPHVRCFCTGNRMEF